MNEIGKVSIKLTADTNDFFSSIKKAVSSAESKGIKLSISADTSALQSSIQKSLASISQLKSTKIDLSADSSSLTRSINKATSDLSSIRGANVPINVENVQALDKVGQVQARLSILQQKADEISIKPSVNPSALSGLELQIASTKSKLETLDPSVVSRAFSSLSSIGTNAFASISNSIQQTTQVVRNLALVTSGVVVGAFSLAVKGAIDYGGELQQNRGDLEVLLGSQESALAVLKEQQKFAGQSPFETGDLIKSATNLSTVIKNVDELNLRTKQLGEAAGGIPANLSRITNTYSQVVSKGKADTVDIKEFINAGFSSIRTEAQKELGLTGEAFDDALSEGALSSDTLNKILDKVTAGFPRLKKASETLPGLFSTASDTIKNFGLSLVGIDTGTFDLKTGGIAKGISDFLNLFNTNETVEALAKFGEKIGSTVASLFSGIDFSKIDLSGFIDSLASGFDSVIKSISEFAKTVKGAFDFIVNSVGGFENFSKILLITAGAIGVVSAALAIFSVVSSPITLTILGIAGAVTLLAKYLGGGDIGKGLGKIQLGFSNAFESIGSIINSTVSSVQSFFKTLSNNFFVVDTINALGDIFQSVFNIIIQYSQAVGNAFRFIWEDLGLGEVIMKQLGDLFTILGGVVYGVIKAIQGLVNVFEFSVKTGKETSEALISAFRPFTQALDTAKFFGGIILNAGDVVKASDNVSQSIDSIGPKFIDLSNSAKLGALGLTDMSDSSVSAEESTKNLNEAIAGLSDTFDKLSGNILSSSEALLRKIDADERVNKSQKAYDDEVKKSGETSKEAIKLFNQLSSAKIQQGKANDSLSKTNGKLLADTEAFILELQKQPGLIDKVKLADIQKNITLTQNAIDLAKRNGENFDQLEKNRLKLVELSQTPANIKVTADTTLADIATDTLKQKVLNSGGIINIDGSITRGLEKTNELVSFINGKVGTVSVGLSDPSKSVVDNLLANIQANLGKRTVYISSAFAPTTGSLAGIFDRKQYGGIIKGFAEGGIVPQYLASGGISKGTDTVPTMLTPGEYVVNKSSTNRFSGIIDSINQTPALFGQFMRDISRVASGNTNNTNNSKTNNLVVNMDIGMTTQGNGVTRAVNNMGYLLQGELLNRGIL